MNMPLMSELKVIYPAMGTDKTWFYVKPATT